MIDQIKHKKTRLETLMIVSIIVIGLSALFFLVNPVVAATGVIAGIGATIGIANQFRRLLIEFKQKMVKASFETLMPDVLYEPLEGFTMDEVYDTKLVQRASRIYTEDQISGTLLGRNFRSSDLLLQNIVSNGKTTTVVTVFQGRFYEIELVNPVIAPIYITRNKYYGFSKFVNMPRIDLEWVDFNEAFDVYSSSEFETFKFLKPRFMEKLYTLKQQYDSIQLAFLANKLYIAINSGIDTFTLTMFQPIDLGYIEEIKKELNDIQIMIETLT